MGWIVDFHPAFLAESRELPQPVGEGLAKCMALLEEFGPALKRPYADTLNGSSHANMKELRFSADNGVWRAAYAFDPARKAILLVAADKAGVNERRFYKTLIDKADARFDDHLKRVKR